jgi:hypothetical protein
VILGLAVAGVLAASWALCAYWYQHTWGYPLQWWAWPFALGLLLFGQRVKKWERNVAWRCPGCKQQHRKTACCDPDCRLCRMDMPHWTQFMASEPPDGYI